MRSVILVIHNVRSCHNVGSMLRTAEGMGVEKVYLTGYTPYPASPGDPRLPHICAKIDKQISKTALGAERLVTWRHFENVSQCMDSLRRDGYQIVALEQAPVAASLSSFKPAERVALVVGSEVGGLAGDILKKSDAVVQIAMRGKKESLNVSVAAGIALYALTEG